MTLLLDDSVVTSFHEFVKENTDPDVMSLTIEDLHAIASLKVGESYTLYFGAGGDTIVTRIGYKEYLKRLD